MMTHNSHARSIDIQLDAPTLGARFRSSRMSRTLTFAIATTVIAAACTPTVKIEAPDKPIEINLNVTITQEVRVRLEQDVEELISENPDLF